MNMYWAQPVCLKISESKYFRARSSEKRTY